MVTPAVTPTVTLSTTPMVDSAVEVPLPPARVQGMPRQGMPSHCASRQPRAAARLGLVDEDVSAFESMLFGYHPRTGRLLTGVRGEGRKKRPRQECLPWMRELFPLST